MNIQKKLLGTTNNVPLWDIIENSKKGYHFITLQYKRWYGCGTIGIFISQQSKWKSLYSLWKTIWTLSIKIEHMHCIKENIYKCCDPTVITCKEMCPAAHSESHSRMLVTTLFLETTQMSITAEWVNKYIVVYAYSGIQYIN